jgi:hypothetical protein
LPGTRVTTTSPDSKSDKDNVSVIGDVEGFSAVLDTADANLANLHKARLPLLNDSSRTRSSISGGKPLKFRNAIEDDSNVTIQMVLRYSNINPISNILINILSFSQIESQSIDSLSHSLLSIMGFIVSLSLLIIFNYPILGYRY